METSIESINSETPHVFQLVRLFKELSVFVYSQIGNFISQGILLLLVVPCAVYGSICLCYIPMPFVYSYIILWSLQRTYEFYKQFQNNRQVAEIQNDEQKFQYTKESFGMGVLHNLTLTTLFISVLISTGASDFFYWCNGDVESAKLSPGFQAISVLLVATTVYSLGHVLVKTFFLPAIYFLSEKRGNFIEALQFSRNIVCSVPKLYVGVLLLEIPFILGFIFFSLILMPFGLIFSFVTTSLFQTSLINSFLLLVYDESDKQVVITSSTGFRWCIFGTFIFLLLISPWIFLYCREVVCETMF